MTHKLKEIIEAEAAKRYAKLESEESCLAEQRFTAGCNFMAGHLEKEFEELKAKIAGDAFEAGKQRKDYEVNVNDWNSNERPLNKQQYLSSINKEK